MQTINYILDKIKSDGHNVSKIANDLGIPVQRFHKWIQGKNMPKTEDALKIRAWARSNLEESIIISKLSEPETEYQAGPNYSMKALFNLTESNKVLAESNRTIAEANNKLATNNEALTFAYNKITGGADAKNQSDVLSTVQALQEFVAGFYGEVNNIPLEEATARLGRVMVQKKKKIEKRGTPGDGGK